MSAVLEKGSAFIWENGRFLERAVFEHRFLNGSPDHILAILAAYQNEDGGFGHALEPDLRAPDSQPLFVEFALRTLYDCRLRAPALVARACDFLEKNSDLARGIPTIFPASLSYPHAGHWNNPGAVQPALDRLTGLVGLANWQGARHPWLEQAVEACVAYLSANRFSDVHTIMNAFCLVESLPKGKNSDALFQKLTGELFHADSFSLEVPVKGYAMTPLALAPSPDAYCRPIFTDSQIEAHLDELASQQEPDGGWPISWDPPGEMARLEWRAYATVSALSTLHAYGRI